MIETMQTWLTANVSTEIGGQYVLLVMVAFYGVAYLVYRMGKNRNDSGTD